MTRQESAGARTAPEPSARGRRAPILLLALIVTVTLLAGLIVAAFRPRPVALRLRFAPGQVLRYKVVVALDGTTTTGERSGSASTRYRLAETVIWRVRSVDRHGVATIGVRAAGAMVSRAGVPPVAVGTNAASETRVAPDGRVLAGGDPSLTLPGLPGVGLPTLDQLSATLPSRPVRQGEAWRTTYDQPFWRSDDALRIDERSRLGGYQDVGRAKTALVAARVTVPLGVSSRVGSPDPPSTTGVLAGPVTAPSVAYTGSETLDQIVWLDPATGRILQGRRSGHLDLNVSFRDFPLLFPTFDPGPAAQSDLPFGGGPQGPPDSATSGSIHFLGRVSMSWQRVP